MYIRRAAVFFSSCFGGGVLGWLVCLFCVFACSVLFLKLSSKLFLASCPQSVLSLWSHSAPAASTVCGEVLQTGCVCESKAIIY